MTVAASFLDILYHKGISLQRISIDLIDSSIVSNVLEAANINTVLSHVIDYKTMLNKNELDITQLVSFHQSRWEQREIDLALTSVHAVYDRLVQLGIPSMRMTDPTNALIKGLEAAKAQAEYMKSQSAQVAVVYISLNELFMEQRKLIDLLSNALQSSVQQLKILCLPSLAPVVTSKYLSRKASSMNSLLHGQTILPSGLAMEQR